MRKVILILFTLVCTTTIGQVEKKVCFFGNSYTYTNDLPAIVENLAEADGNLLIKDHNTPGGYTLEAHSTNTITLEKISANTWDYVVLQGQSQRPSFPWTDVQVDVFPYAQILCDFIRSANSCAIPVFFNTWGRRDGDPMWDSINTFTKMNERLQIAYDFMANSNSAMLSPVGIGFEHIANDAESPIDFADLYVGDGSHPSFLGSYLSGCIFYELIFETSVVGNTYIYGGISESDGAYLQEVAHHVLTEVDSIQTHYIQPVAGYTVVYDGPTATYTNTSVHAFSYLWEFSDGTTSTEENPVHVFPDEGENSATLTAYYCERESVTTDGSNVGFFTEEKPTFRVYPNPAANGHITIENFGTPQKLFVFLLDGKLITQQLLIESVQLNLNRGIYLVHIGNRTEKLIVR